MFRINEPHVAWEDVGGEVILVRIESGGYFCVSGTGADALRRLASGMSIFATTTSLAEHYRIPVSSVADALADFVSQLIAEELLVPFASRFFYTNSAQRVLQLPPLAANYTLPELNRIDQHGNRLPLTQPESPREKRAA